MTPRTMARSSDRDCRIAHLALLTLVALAPASLAAQIPRAPLPDSAMGQVLVLGTIHLRQLGDAFRPGQLTTLLDHLQQWRPDVIAVEAMPPEEIERLDLLARETGDSAAAQIRDGFAAGIAERGATIRGRLGIPTRQAAAEQAVSRLADRTEAPADRRQVTALLLAALDEPSAVLQWSYLPPTERHAGDGIDVSDAARLGTLLANSNEKWTIAAALGRRLGLRRLASIDDHVDDEVGLRSGLYDELQDELATSPAVAAYMASPAAQAQAELLDSARTALDLWPIYRRINDPTWMRRDVEGQWHLFYRTTLPSGADRRRVALWEARNLNIAGRIRASAAPGGRTLVVIGAAHKPFLDDYLSEMMDLQVKQLDDLR